MLSVIGGLLGVLAAVIGTQFTIVGVQPVIVPSSIVLALGVSKQAIREAMHVAYLFNIYDRLADSLGWDVPDKASGFYQSSAKMLLKRGYL